MIQKKKALKINFFSDIKISNQKKYSRFRKFFLRIFKIFWTMKPENFRI